MDLWIATSNAGKLKEFQNMAMSSQLKIRTPKELDFYTSPKETGETFLENAKIKAQSLYKSLSDKNTWVLAEDSGLLVDGLDGLPGIHTARYAGPNARDSENNAKLMKMMGFKSPQNRNAHFFCSIFVISPEGKELSYEAKLEGTIAKKLAGTSGFGYDPLFIPNGETKTLAELEPSFKAKNSHRSKAFKEFLAKLNSPA